MIVMVVLARTFLRGVYCFTASCNTSSWSPEVARGYSRMCEVGRTCSRTENLLVDIAGRLQSKLPQVRNSADDQWLTASYCLFLTNMRMQVQDSQEPFGCMVLSKRYDRDEPRLSFALARRRTSMPAMMHTHGTYTTSIAKSKNTSNWRQK